MGLFDDIIDTVVNLPGKVVEKTIETAVRVPEAGVKIITGAIDGVEKGVKKVEKSLDKHSY